MMAGNVSAAPFPCYHGRVVRHAFVVSEWFKFVRSVATGNTAGVYRCTVVVLPEM